MSHGITQDDLRQEASRLVTEWVFPGECYHTPDVDTMARADKLGAMLLQRMSALVAEGTDPRGKTLAELMPGLNPNDIVLTEADYC